MDKNSTKEISEALEQSWKMFNDRIEKEKQSLSMAHLSRMFTTTMDVEERRFAEKLSEIMIEHSDAVIKQNEKARDGVKKLMDELTNVQEEPTEEES